MASLISTAEEAKAGIRNLVKEVLQEEQMREDIRQDHYVRSADVAARFSINKSTIWRWIESGKLPKPFYLNGSRVWLNSAILEAEKKIVSDTLECSK